MIQNIEYIENELKKIVAMTIVLKGALEQIRSEAHPKTSFYQWADYAIKKSNEIMNSEDEQQVSKQVKGP